VTSRRALAFVAVVAAACGGKVSAGGDVDAGAPETIVEPGTPLPPPTYVDGCPSSPPSLGTSCPTGAGPCEYGSDPNPACNAIVACGGGVWQKGEGLPACPGSALTSGHACPSPYPPDPRSKTSCTGNLGALCDYRYPSPSGGVVRVECGCQDDAKLGPIWDCANVITDANCPFPPALLGTSCPGEGLSCPRLAHFAGWPCIPTEVCTGGGWTLKPCTL
jgi:hypothetical protein